jgi:hypothetical protein
VSPPARKASYAEEIIELSPQRYGRLTKAVERKLLLTSPLSLFTSVEKFVFLKNSPDSTCPDIHGGYPLSFAQNLYLCVWHPAMNLSNPSIT